MCANCWSRLTKMQWTEKWQMAKKCSLCIRLLRNLNSEEFCDKTDSHYTHTFVCYIIKVKRTNLLLLIEVTQTKVETTCNWTSVWPQKVVSVQGVALNCSNKTLNIYKEILWSWSCFGYSYYSIIFQIIRFVSTQLFTENGPFFLIKFKYCHDHFILLKNQNILFFNIWFYYI